MSESQTQGLDSARYGTEYFVALDQRKIGNENCVLVHLGSCGMQLLRSDFDMALECFVGLEVMAWVFDEFRFAPVLLRWDCRYEGGTKMRMGRSLGSLEIRDDDDDDGKCLSNCLVVVVVVICGTGGSW